MFFFFISFLSFLLFLSKSLSLQPLPPWASEVRLLPLPACRELLGCLSRWLVDSRQVAAAVFALLPVMTHRKRSSHRVENVDSRGEMSILDLPELTLEIILGRLSPAGLCNLAAVCNSLRERCRSDHLWRRHMEEKWGSLMGPAAQRGWKSFVSSCEDNLAPVGAGYRREWLRVLSCVWPLSWLTSKFGAAAETKPWLPDNSIMSWYLAIETGFFRFPAQVFNRENGHVGFMLSCYDAELSYDSRTDTFTARLRAPPVESSAHDLHVSDCLADLRPGDHVEIQWRRNKEFPYGWWYGVVGHLGSCGGNELHCRCHRSDAVALEFNQYTEGSRWRRAILSRKDHREEGNEAEGFYGGVRKLRRDDEIAAWRRLWPTGVLD
ncbi:unnamed protein product [Spirodela intermedia]|uniref:F-box domain-containing protein n=1 Tax=Spirodela intermedia TaxID=51605 RepID=A0A7I8JYF8_SPIIN|nr:unnamed protein product [Spirodela intermedia]